MKAPSSIIVRVAEPADQAAVFALKCVLWEHHHRSEPELFRPFDQIHQDAEPAPPAFQVDARLAVAERDGRVVGYARGALRNVPLSYAYFPRRIAVLQEIAVDPTARRAGIASRLIADMSEWARANEATALEVPVMGFNREAIALYRGMGFGDGQIQMRMKL